MSSFLKFFPFLIPLLLFSCETKSPYQQGEILYVNFCSNCHMTDGAGLANLIPPMNDGAYLRANPLEIACTIRNGAKGEIEIGGKVFNNEMDPIPVLNDVEITNVINYLLFKWGETDQYVSNKDIQEILNECTVEDHSRNF